MSCSGVLFFQALMEKQHSRPLNIVVRSDYRHLLPAVLETAVTIGD